MSDTNEEIATQRIATLTAAATPEAAAELRDLADSTTDKQTRKEARRALYLLSQKGCRPTPRAPQSAAPAEARETLRCWASVFDGAGNRMLLFLLPDPDGGSPTLLQILINDEVGIKDIGSRRLPRREVDTLIGNLEGQLEQGLALAEIEPDYGRWLLEQAREINRRQRRMTPEGFLDFLPRIGAPHHPVEASPIYDFFDAKDVRADQSFPHEPEALFALPWFEPWFFAVEDVLPWLVRLREGEQGVVVVPESVKRDRHERLIADALAALMPPEIRADYVHRLEESADILRRRGETTAAKQAFLQAQGLKDARIVAESPFARTLLDRTLDAAREMIEAMNKRAQESGNAPRVQTV
jgi:hypothetical protein